MKKIIVGSFIILKVILFITYGMNYAFASGDLDSQRDRTIRALAVTATAQATAKSPTDEYFITDSGYELDQYLFRTDGDGKITFDIDVNRVLGEVDSSGHLLSPDKVLGGATTATLRLRVFDVDEDYSGTEVAPEVDDVYVNDNKLISAPLSGANNQWSSYSYDVPIEYLIFPQATNSALSDGSSPSALNKIEIQIDVANSGGPVWAVEVDWGSLEIKGIRPVVLVHGIGALGFGGSPTTWNTFGGVLGNNYLLHYAPALSPSGAIIDNAKTLADKISNMRMEWGVDKVNVVASSKGGLDTRQYLAANKDVLNLIMIGTPNEGSPLADAAKVAKIIAAFKTGGLAGILIGFVGEPALSQLTPSYVKRFNERVGANGATSYHVIAGDKRWGYNPFTGQQFKGAPYLPGEDDWVVQVASVKSLGYTNELGDLNRWHLATYDQAEYDLMEAILTSTTSSSALSSVSAQRTLRSLASSSASSSSSEPLIVVSSIANEILSGTNTETIVVDSTSQVSFLLAWGTDNSSGEADLDLTLEDPNGNVINPSVASSDPNIAYEVVEEEPSMKIETYVITDPVASTWKLKVNAISTTDTVGYFVTAFTTSDVALTLATDKEWYLSGEQIIITGTLAEGGTAITGASVSGTIKKPDDSVDTITLYDDGGNGDSGPNDGIYGAIYTDTQAGGIYDIVIDATGSASGGSFTRAKIYSVTVAPSTSDQFNDIYSESTTDTDGDGLYNTLVINVGVNIVTAGEYEIVGTLEDENGNTIEATNTSASLSTGSNSVPLNFDGLTIYQNGIDGHYYLKNLHLYYKTGEPVQTDICTDAYTTSPYSYTEFQRSAISLTSNRTDTRVDTDGNGKYDYLNVDLEIDVVTPGDYDINARLMDSNGAEIVWASTSVTFSSKQTVTLQFDGSKIGERGVDGPYTVRDLSVYQTSGGSASETFGVVYTTPTYLYDEFENAVLTASVVADSTSGNVPLTVSFSATARGGTTPYSYSWDFENDGTEDSTAQNPSHTYDTSGVYIVTLQITDGLSNTATDSETISVSASTGGGGGGGGGCFITTVAP